MSGELLLWAGCVREYPLAERIAAMQAGRFTQTSLFPADVRRAEQSGTRAAELRRMFNDGGVAIEAVEPLTKWLPSWEPGPSITAEEVAFADFEEAELFAMARELGAQLLTLNEFFGEPVAIEIAAESMARVCDRAAGEGLRIALEPMPFSGVGDLTTAWEIVRLAGRPNGGLVLDAWHFFRKGAELELLRSIPAASFFGIQLDDAPAQPDGPVKEESMHRRLLPGAGELDLQGFLDSVGPLPADCLIGPEIFSDEAWTLPAEELGRALGDATRSVLANRV